MRDSGDISGVGNRIGDRHRSCRSNFLVKIQDRHDRSANLRYDPDSSSTGRDKGEARQISQQSKNTCPVPICFILFFYSVKLAFANVFISFFSVADVARTLTLT